MVIKACDEDHPYVDGYHGESQCGATDGVYRCTQDEGHEVPYHTTYGISNTGQIIEYWFVENKYGLGIGTTDQIRDARDFAIPYLNNKRVYGMNAMAFTDRVSHYREKFSLDYPDELSSLALTLDDPHPELQMRNLIDHFSYLSQEFRVLYKHPSMTFSEHALKVRDSHNSWAALYLVAYMHALLETPDVRSYGEHVRKGARWAIKELSVYEMRNFSKMAKEEECQI